MLAWLSQFVPEWLANFVISLMAAFWGVAMRLGHKAARNKTWVEWRQFVLEVPTLFGMAIIAGPVGRWLHSAYAVDLEVTYALCVCFGYLGANLIARAAAWLEKWSGGDEKDD